MMKYLTAGLDWVWNLKFLQGIRHKAFRWTALALSVYVVLSTKPESPFVGLPDVPTEWYAGFVAWLATKGIEFAKVHKPE